MGVERIRFIVGFIVGAVALGSLAYFAHLRADPETPLPEPSRGSSGIEWREEVARPKPPGLAAVETAAYRAERAQTPPSASDEPEPVTEDEAKRRRSLKKFLVRHVGISSGLLDAVSERDPRAARFFEAAREESRRISNIDGARFSAARELVPEKLARGEYTSGGAEAEDAARARAAEGDVVLLHVVSNPPPGTPPSAAIIVRIGESRRLDEATAEWRRIRTEAQARIAEELQALELERSGR